jgi:hypothetical protein
MPDVQLNNPESKKKKKKKKKKKTKLNQPQPIVDDTKVIYWY